MRKHNTWWLHIASRDKTRNPKQCQMSQIENSKRASLQAEHFRDLEIRILNLFRISKFELRISKGKLDHFVNLVATKKSWPRASYCRGTEPPMNADSRRCNALPS